MSSVRPICASESVFARGEPLASYTAFFGLTGGILTHLKMHGMSAHKNWFPNNRAKMTGTVLLLGGFFGGYYIGQKVFGDPALTRLVNSHEQDKSYIQK